MQFLYEKSCLLDKKTIRKTAESLLPYVAHLRNFGDSGQYTFKESSINLPGDAAIFKAVSAMKQSLAGQELRYILVIGIGGSSLGAKAVYDALLGYFDPLEERRYPKILFADTNDPEFSLRLSHFLSQSIYAPDHVLVNAVSKSGGTTETIANLELVMSVLEDRFSNASGRLVLTTDFGSPLWREGGKKKLAMLPLPPEVGGRYSVFSAAGLFPLACSGIDIGSFRRGGETLRDLCLIEDAQGNPALISASILYLHYLNGKTINDNFFFHPELESLGKWYRQLMGESIGKEKNVGGETVNVGITPTVSIGSTDLHSLGQLYLGGPKDKFTTFLSTKTKGGVGVGSERFFPALVPELRGKTFGEVMQAVFEGVKKTYLASELPFAEIALTDISPLSLGEYMQFKMIEVMYLGKLLDVDPFDQPSVERYKTETREILNS